MDAFFWSGVGAVVSAIVVFCGSIWLLLSTILGARLAYFVTATITLAFTLIMGAVWSFTELGPVGDLPSFEGVAIGANTAEVEFGAAAAYPGGDWVEPSEDDEAQRTKVVEAESEATDYFEAAIDAGEIEPFTEGEQEIAPQVVAESGRLIEVDGTEYAAVLLRVTPVEGQTSDESIDPDAEGTVLAILEYDPGNPLGIARQITLGVLVLFVIHIFGLSRAERNAARIREAAGRT